jgi:hypothetical protein
VAAQRGFELLNPETRGRPLAKSRKRWGYLRLIFIAERSQEVWPYERDGADGAPEGR